MLDYSFIPILERIKKIKAEQKLTNEALSKKSGIPMGTLSKVLAGIINDPKIGIIIALTDALNVDINLLIHDQKCYSPDKFTPQEQDHIKKYRALDERGKKAIDDTLEREYGFVNPAEKEHSATCQPSDLSCEEIHRLLDKQLDDVEKGTISSASTVTNGSKMA